MAFLETPRTEAGNATLLMSGHHIDDLSFEHSFQSPKKRQHGLVQDLRKQRGILSTTSDPVLLLSRRPDLDSARRPGEFTPLLKSASKRDQLAGKGAPAVAKPMRHTRSGLAIPSNDEAQQLESSVVYATEHEDSKTSQDAARPLQLDLESSAVSTPLAVPHARGVSSERNDQPHLSLREQEKASHDSASHLPKP